MLNTQKNKNFEIKFEVENPEIKLILIFVFFLFKPKAICKLYYSVDITIFFSLTMLKIYSFEKGSLGLN